MQAHVYFPCSNAKSIQAVAKVWAITLASLGLFSGSAQAAFYSEQYEMIFSPAAEVGTVNGFTLAVATGTGTLGPSGSTFSGGIMTFLDDSNSSADQGFYLPPGSGLLSGSTSFLADFRIRMLQDNLPLSTGKVMSFKSGNGRGLHMDTDGVQFVNGGGGVGSATGFDFTTNTECRVIVNGPANTIDLFVSSTGKVNTPSSSYVNLARTTMGGSGFAGELGTIGFALGSLAGSSTTLANFELDWFRVAVGTTDTNSVWEAAGRTAPTINSIGFTPVVTGDYCWTNFAGSLTQSGDLDGTGNAALFTELYGIDINGAGDTLIVCDRQAGGVGKIKKITLPGAVVTTVQSGYNLVQCVINKVNGNLYFPDITGAGTIYRLAPPYTGTPVAIATEYAFGLGIDSASDTLYVAGQSDNLIWYIPNAGAVTPGALTLLAGSGTAGFLDGTLANAQFSSPMGMAVVVSGGNTNIYVMDRGNHALRHINVGANSVSTVAGNGSGGTADGTGSSAQFSQPHNVVMGPDGNLYVCDQDNYTVRKVTLPEAVVTTISGINQNASNNGGAADGCGSAAGNGNLGQITIDSAGRIYTADRGGASGSFPRVSKGTAPGGSIIEVQIDFTAGPKDTSSMFILQSSSNVDGGYSDVAPPAAITKIGAGLFRAVTPPNGNAQFYRIRLGT